MRRDPAIRCSVLFAITEKPKEWHYLIETVDDEPRLELFARRKRHGWASWGNEIANDVEMPNSYSNDSKP